MMQERYLPENIEQKWQARWKEEGAFACDHHSPKPKYYLLEMFPYPSGKLHMGHVRNYSIGDVVARFKRMQGFNVLHPMGWDAFGLPAENYAIKTGTHPRQCTDKNIHRFREQIKALGFSYDWDREIDTTDPNYYKWTQWIFLQLYKMGLAYEAEKAVNWCPELKAVLANEEVVNGKSEVGGFPVVKMPMKQWNLKITAYAERLLEDLDLVDWPEPVKMMQRNWIGKSEGAYVDFTTESGEKIRVYTTRPDTLFGCTYMVLAPEHPLVGKITTAEQKAEVEAYKEEAAKKSDLDRTDLAKTKTGVFTGAYAINPVNGKKVPIWISDYVLITYGTGAIMAVPAHDQRDYDFAKKFGLPIIQVIAGGSIEEAAWEGDGELINSEFLNGLHVKESKAKMTEWLTAKGKGEKAVNYRLRDWVFSRQRYWGEPIPIVHCPDCGIVPLDEKDLPLRLPDVKKYEPSGTGESPLAGIEDWLYTPCPKCGKTARRETNTMPQWAGSSWYYLRYCDPKNSEKLIDPEKEKYWLPVSLYVGGTEHAVLHLLYARFWHKVLYDLGVVTTKEPFMKLLNQGMILGEDGEKMSKSRGNVINPDDVIAKVGADSLRLYEMFMGPLDQMKPWNTKGIEGVSRFLQRAWRLVLSDRIPQDPETEVRRHKMIKKVGEDIQAFRFNTAISAMMIFVNDSQGGLSQEDAESLVLCLSPFAPHIAEELWEKIGGKGLCCKQAWPAYDPAKTVDATIELVVQINGKVRAKIQVPADVDKEKALQAAKENEIAAKWLEGKEIVKEIFVPGKLLNIVVKG